MRASQKLTPPPPCQQIKCIKHLDILSQHKWIPGVFCKLFRSYGSSSVSTQWKNSPGCNVSFFIIKTMCESLWSFAKMCCSLRTANDCHKTVSPNMKQKAKSHSQLKSPNEWLHLDVGRVEAHDLYCNNQ